MAGTNGQSSYRKSILTMVILSMLNNEDTYGYQIVQELERQTDGFFTLQEGALYPIMYELVEKGYISNERIIVGKRMARVYYHIEESGKDVLGQLIEEYTKSTASIMRIIKRGTNDESC